ncbi:MAG: purple acid phosphatase family protein [Candidatus Acetothermia bacterium]
MNRFLKSRWPGAVLAFLLILLVVLSPAGASEVPDGEIGSWGPYLTLVDGPTPVVNWRTEREVVGRVEYGRLERYLETGNLGKTIEEEDGAGNFHHLRLEGLSPGKEYAYRVSPGKEGVFRFKSPREEAEDFDFLVYGDTQTCPIRHRLVASEMAEDSTDPTFVLHSGDLVKSPIDSRWSDFFWANAPFSTSTPLMPALGNHENDDDSYYKAFALPEGGGRYGKEWYSFEYGPVKFIILDSNAGQIGLKRFSEEKAWLEEELKNQTRPGTVVVFHHPMYSSVYSTGVDSGLEKSWGSLFEKYGVDLVLSGHMHSYERIEKSGTTYVVAGGGGGPSGYLEGQFDFSRKTRGNSLHYLRARVEDEEIKLQAVEVASVGYVEGIEDSPCSFDLSLTRSVFDEVTVDLD